MSGRVASPHWRSARSLSLPADAAARVSAAGAAFLRPLAAATARLALAMLLLSAWGIVVPLFAAEGGRLAIAKPGSASPEIPNSAAERQPFRGEYAFTSTGATRLPRDSLPC
ncbi:MAG: hypothetical protein AB7F78_09100 [Hyphomicrobiaceae bacterium]